MDRVIYVEITNKVSDEKKRDTFNILAYCCLRSGKTEIIVEPHKDKKLSKINNRNEIVAILPAFNEEVSIGGVVLRAKRYVGRVIVVDDGSNDRTAELAKLAGAEVIRHQVNKGKGAALKTGFEFVDNEQIIVTIDADGQHDPSEIPKLVEPILKGEADIVNGSRYINDNKKGTPLYRRIGQLVLDKATNLDSGLNITDSQSGFRAFAAHVKDIFKFEQSGFAIESEMLVEAAEAKLTIKEIEIGVQYDVNGSSENPISHGMRVLLSILQDMQLRRPLYYFTIPGFVVATISLATGPDLLHAFYHDVKLQFDPTILIFVLTLMGSAMMVTGIILHSTYRHIGNNR